MIRTTVKTTSYFAQTTEAIQARARDGVTVAARKAMTVAQAGASIDLQLRLVGVSSTGSGYSAGIVSLRQSDTGTERIATFFDKGTLGNRKGKLRPRTRRKASWTDKRGRTYNRHPIEPGTGIKAERFFLKARLEGRRALVEHVRGGLG